jgi:phenylalanyl-tRNA synthetase beta chain
MPTSTCDKKYLMKLLQFKISEEELIKNINNIGINVKGITDKEIEIEFNADRPDVISAVGLARALRYFMRRSRDFDYEVKDEEEGFEITVGSNVSKVRPYVSALVVKNIRLGEEELKDIINFTDKLSETYGRKRKKIAIGLHDLKEVKPPFSYDSYEDEQFIPLNRAKQMRYSEVLEKEEKGRDYGHLMGKSGRKYVALKDSIGTMALVPIINSERTRVSSSTKSIIIDITGNSKYVIEKIADMLAANFIDMDCDVYRVKVNYGGKSYSLPRMERTVISIPLEQVNKELGVSVGFNNVILLGNKMGHEAALVGRNIRFRVPAYRIDVLNDQDVIEDIAIAYGYDYIQPIPLPTVNQGTLEEKDRIMRGMGEAMVGLGFMEAMNSYVTNEDINFRNMRVKDKDAIKISNPKTAMATMFRTWLTPSLLKELSMSMHDRLPHRLFELDMAFRLEDDMPIEQYHLAAVNCDAQVNFNDMKATFESFAGVQCLDCKIRKGSNASAIDGRCAEILLDDDVIGFIEEIHPEVLSNFGIEEPVTAFEIDLSGWLAEDGKGSKETGNSEEQS